jgi:competence transcription factor ComK
VPKGELRLLNILDEANEIHPKLLEEVGTRGSLDKITRQRLSQYIKTNQKDAISKRIVRNNKHSRQIKELGDEFANIKENTFHVRGITRKNLIIIQKHHTKIILFLTVHQSLNYPIFLKQKKLESLWVEIII